MGGMVLLGNGASRAVWDDFKYESLYETASSNQVDHALTSEDVQIFEEMDTQNFEQVHAALATSEVVCSALGMSTEEVKERYRSIRRSLFEAVSHVHVPWREEDKPIYRKIRDALSEYEFVYSTNYDLVVYWSIMTAGAAGFKDFLWDETFDITNTEVWGKSTKVLYLHGGIHLAKHPGGSTFKRMAPYGNLLTSLHRMDDDTTVPLFVTEGSSKDKLSSIYRSDYLSFAYQSFAQHAGPLVIFGHSLDEADMHLVDAISSGPSDRLAVSVLPGSSRKIRKKKADMIRKLPEKQLTFFNSTTHPLGSSELRIDRS